MIKYLAIAITMPLFLLSPIRGNAEIVDFDLVKEEAIASKDKNIKQYLMELTILQIEEHEKYVSSKGYGPKSFLEDLNEVEQALDTAINNCDYSRIATLDALVDARKSCDKQTKKYKLLLKKVKANIAKK